MQESICSIASASEINLELQDGLAISDVTRQAYSILGENVVICAADQHTCKECTQPYKKTADIITGDNPAALVGMDKNWNVPAYVGENADLAELANSRGASFCPYHEHLHVAKYCVKNCDVQKIAGTQAYKEHQGQ